MESTKLLNVAMMAVELGDLMTVDAFCLAMWLGFAVETLVMGGADAVGVEAWLELVW